MANKSHKNPSKANQGEGNFMIVAHLLLRFRAFKGLLNLQLALLPGLVEHGQEFIF